MPSGFEYGTPGLGIQQLNHWAIAPLKCDSLKKAINIMESEFVECIKQAELESNIALVIKGNGLKSKSEETKQDLSTLEAVIKIE